MSGVLKKDDNGYPVSGGVSSSDANVVLNLKVNPSTGRLLVDSAAGSGTVTDVSVVTANGFAGTVANSTTTPAITLTTTITGILSGNGTAISAASTTGTGAVVLASSPTLTTPNIGAATGTSLSVSGLLASATGLTLEETGAGTDIITLQAPASIAASYTLTLPVDDGTPNQFLQTDGSGVLAWATGNSGTVTTVSVVTANGVSGSVANATTTPAITLTLGTITPTSVNGLTISTTTGTLTITNGKIFSVTNTLTLSGTDSTVMTFPTTSATIARTDAGNTFTGVSTASAWVLTSPTITTKISPTSDDGAPLGDTTHNFSDLFLASGAVINYANSNVVITHTSGILTMGTGELRITSANVGTNADSVPTLSSTSTLTNKTLTSPTIQTLPVFAAGANIKYTVPSSDTTGTGVITNEFNSGYSSTAIGELVYLDSSATWQKADADASAATYSSLLGIALSVTASGNAATVLLQGFVYAASQFPTFTIGAPVYMSATAAAVTQTAPTTTDSATRIVGYGVHADKMWFCPSNDWITHT